MHINLNHFLSSRKPDVWPIVEAKTGLQWGKGIVFTYGNTIYSEDHPLKEDVLVHELVHVRQQSGFQNLEEYLNQYLNDQMFRYEMELEAYRAQWQFLKKKLLFAKDKRLALDRLVDALMLDIGSNSGIFTQKRKYKNIMADIIKE